MDDCAHYGGTGGRLAARSPHSSGVVAYISDIGKVGNRECHQVHLHNFFRDINFSLFLLPLCFTRIQGGWRFCEARGVDRRG